MITPYDTEELKRIEDYLKECLTVSFGRRAYIEHVQTHRLYSEEPAYTFEAIVFSKKARFQIPSGTSAEYVRLTMIECVKEAFAAAINNVPIWET